jgi:hypothetical protein
MANLATADVTTICDVLARMYDLQAALLGADETTSSTWRKGMKSIWDTALAAADTAEAQTPLTNLCAPANDLRTAFNPTAFVKDRLLTVVNGLVTECDADLGSYLDDNDLRVHYSFGDLFYYATGLRLSPISVVFPPVQSLYTAVRASTTWASTVGTPVDTTKYGGAQLTLRATHAIGSGEDAVATLTCVKLDGGTEQQVVTMPKDSVLDTYVDVGTAANIYTSVSAMVVTGGNASDALAVETKLTRSIAAAI